ncbi:MAG: DUF2914 domain-containing protein, partial [Myxococcota bacterium]
MKSLITAIILMLLTAYAWADARPGVELTPRDSGPSVVDLAIASSIADREPADPGEAYPANVGKLYCWSKIKNTDGETSVKHVWRLGDKVMGERELQIGKSARWRTWTTQRINPKATGQWSCEVVDSAGESLG